MRQTLMLFTVVAALTAGGPVFGEHTRRFGVAQTAGEYVVSDQIISTSEGPVTDEGCDCVDSCGGAGQGKAQQAASAVANCLAHGSPTPGGMHPDFYDPNSVVTPNGNGYIGRQFTRPDLFYNYFTQGEANHINAQMYIAPVPVPPWVGNTFYTYQPFMPHEMLHSHKDRYHHFYDNGRGLNRTKIRYTPGIHQVARDMYFNFRIPR